MLAIAIDSSQESCVLALGNESQLLAEYAFYSKMSLLRRIVPNAQRLLGDAGHKVDDLDAVIVSLGPGSFTGLRIGVSVAKSLAYALSRPIVGLGTLDAIARSVAPVRSDLICPMIHARPNEVYWSLFNSSGERRIVEYAASGIQDVLHSVKEVGPDVYFCGSGANRNAGAIRDAFGERAIIAAAFAGVARGAVLIEMGLSRIKEGAIDDACTLTPLYIRKPTPLIRLESGELDPNRR